MTNLSGCIVLMVLCMCHAANVLVSYGVRPFYLVDGMIESYLKSNLTECMFQTPQSSDFSIGHRGAALQFPEHTKESYIAAARMGAGIVECE